MSRVDQATVRTIRMLAGDTRQRILGGVGLGMQRAPELSRRLKLPLSTVRSNLSRLEEAGLIVAKRTRGRAQYSLGKTVRVSSLDRGQRVALEVKTASGGKIELTRSMKALPRKR